MSVLPERDQHLRSGLPGRCRARRPGSPSPVDGPGPPRKDPGNARRRRRSAADPERPQAVAPPPSAAAARSGCGRRGRALSTSRRRRTGSRWRRWWPPRCARSSPRKQPGEWPPSRDLPTPGSPGQDQSATAAQQARPDLSQLFLPARQRPLVKPHLGGGREGAGAGCALCAHRHSGIGIFEWRLLMTEHPNRCETPG
jgi:hypothetical protein